MTSDHSNREYDIVLFGASGYTGKYTAEHIHCNLPTDISWAIAGRTASKLSAINDFLKPLNRDRTLPTIETCSLELADLEALAKRTKVLINTVGPYAKYSAPVVEACAKNGTHYLDCTGETPWVYNMIKKYHDVAKSNNAIIISQCAFESVPADMIAFALVSTIKQKLSVGTNSVVSCLADLKSRPSGGTLATTFGIFESFSLPELSKTMRPWALSAKPGPAPPPRTLANKVFGVRKHPDLGYITTSITGRTNAAIVERSWSFLDYGPNFNYEENARVRGRIMGFAVHLALGLGAFALAFSPLRWLAKKLVYQPGEGPSKEDTAQDQAEYYAVASADTSPPRTAKAHMKWKGSMYHLTGMTLAEAAITLVRDDSPAKKIGGGYLTPATLGQAYLERLDRAGMKFEAHVED